MFGKEGRHGRSGHELRLPGCRAAHNVEEDSARVRRQVRTLTEAAKDRPGYICADISEGVEAVRPPNSMIVQIRPFSPLQSQQTGVNGTPHRRRSGLCFSQA